MACWLLLFLQQMVGLLLPLGATVEPISLWASRLSRQGGVEELVCGHSSGTEQRVWSENLIFLCAYWHDEK